MFGSLINSRAAGSCGARRERDRVSPASLRGAGRQPPALSQPCPLCLWLREPQPTFPGRAGAGDGAHSPGPQLLSSCGVSSSTSGVGPEPALLPGSVAEAGAMFHGPRPSPAWACWLALVRAACFSLRLPGGDAGTCLPGHQGRASHTRDTRRMRGPGGNEGPPLGCPSQALARQTAAQGSRGPPEVTGQVSWALGTLPRPYLSASPSALCTLVGWRAWGR